MTNKYVIKNCDSSYYNIDDKLVCAAFKKPEPYFCQDCTNCLLKKVVGECKETLAEMDKDSGRNAYAGGRCIEAENILRLFEIEEIKNEKTKNEK